MKPSTILECLKRSPVILSIWVLSIGSGAGPSVPPAEAEGIIFERQQIMLQLEKDSKMLGMISAGTESRDKLAATTRGLAQGAKDSMEAFRPAVPGGRSKAEVWSQREEFMKRMEAFVAKSEEMAKRGEAGNMTGVTELMVEALPCKACHDIYRAPKR